MESKLGLSKDDIREAICHPVEERRLATPVYTIILYTAVIRGETFVITSYYRDQDFYIDYTFKVKKELVDKVQSSNPVSILVELANRFGIDVVVAGLKGKFLFNETTPLNASHQFSLQNLTREYSRLGLAFIFAHDFIEGGNPYLECTIAFNIDRMSYFRWLSAG
jgi:hypothetical protein